MGLQRGKIEKQYSVLVKISVYEFETSLLLSCHSTSVMCFLFNKQPSELSRALCTSECPPHNVLHDMNDYPSYYDPVYFPTNYPSIFDSEDSVCEWLLMGLKKHSFVCCSCVFLQNGFEQCEDSVRYNASMFEIKFHCVQIQVSILYIESSMFSFCRLHHLLFHLISKLSGV